MGAWSPWGGLQLPALSLVRNYMKYKYICMLFKKNLGTARFRYEWDIYFHQYRDAFVNVPSQWEMALHCNVVSHWLGAFTKGSLQSVHKHDYLHDSWGCLTFKIVLAAWQIWFKSVIVVIITMKITIMVLLITICPNVAIIYWSTNKNSIQHYVLWTLQFT